MSRVMSKLDGSAKTDLVFAILAMNAFRKLREELLRLFFNTLQVMIVLCDSEPEKTKPALIHFSEYLRGNLESITNDRLIPFTKELGHTKEYLALEQYGDGREFEVEYRLQTTQFMVPPLVLQPIVENEVRYGIGARSKGGRIVIETRETPFVTLIRVIDDGAGRNSMTAQSIFLLI